MVSIIIPTVNRHRQLIKLIDSIRQQDIDPESLEIVVVYNFNTKNTSSVRLPAGPGLRILQAPHPGVNHARNTGILAARGDILIFIDDDCLMEDPQYLAKVIQKHQEQPDRLSLGGPYKLSPKASFWDKVYFTNMTQWLDQQKISARATKALLGGNATYKSSVFADGRRFTPGIKYGGSETIFNERIYEDFGPHGFYPDLALTHQSQISARDFLYKAYMQGRGYAEQTKHTTAHLEQPLDTQVISSRAIRWALALYSFVFMIGYRTSIYERRWWLTSFFEETGVYLKKPFAPFLNAFFYAKKIMKEPHVPS